MRAAVLTSNSLRHRYFIQTVAKSFDLRFALQEPKKRIQQTAQEELDDIRRHFEQLSISEKEEFEPHLETRSINALKSVENINDPALVDEIRTNVDVVLLFGTSILNEHWLTAFPDRIINLHLGLSPFYRGAATLFWPIANNEIACVGTTIHLAVHKVDAGPILRRIKPELRLGDSYYQLTNRLIRQSIDAVPGTALEYFAGRITPLQQAAEKTIPYRKRDFNSDALNRALNIIGDGLTSEQILAATKSDRCACSQ